ncbi:MAG: DUF4271 domain-containing protein [Lunatimonas sp.]|uniref:DUF4271 domain-containing protein n=1 Tax=Lunatimonas sp. TaxID=2060141 RepID=UPI00263BC459|nr:DUF4271 domain-containing protein [Lunatimonas sp.]MCC5937745.1 DUF4271 domain-containing protein [Lunatimonas sp.]
MNRRATLVQVLFAIYMLTSVPALSQVLENYDGRISYLPATQFYLRSEGVQLTVDLTSFPMSALLVRLPEGSSLFIDHILWLQTDADTLLRLPLEELNTVLSSGSSSAELTVYKKGISLNEVSVRKIGPQTHSVHEQASIQVFADSYAARDRDVFSEFFFTALCFLMLLGALFRVIHPVVFPLFLNPRYLISSEEFTEGGSFTKFFTNALLYYLLLLNMLLMLVFITVSNYLAIAPIGLSLSNDINHYFFLWIAGTLILMAASILKIIWLRINVYIFGIAKFEIPHFLYILRVLSLSILLISCVMIIGIANEYQAIEDVVIFFLKAFIWFYILALFLLGVLMSKRLSFKNYHLFSYICTSELIPFLVISRLLIG